MRAFRLVWLCAFAFGLNAQSPAAFEVASIRRNASGSFNTNIQISEGGRVNFVNASLKTLIRNAWGILSFQLAGEPGWIDTEMYDIQAKTSTPGMLSQDDLKPLLQSLLADRFHLRVHWEEREGTVYTLLVDKGQPRLTAGSADEKPGMNTSKGPDKIVMKGTAQPMKLLASNLGNQLGRFVVDKTGLTGVYDFTVQWDPQSTADSSGPSLFAALKEQLGLRLESGKGTVEMLVVDSAERPTEN